MIPRLFLALSLFFHIFTGQAMGQEDRIPFYEDYLKKSDINGFIRQARQFLEEKPEAIEAPRLAMDYLMAAKIARNSEAVEKAIGYLLFRYPNSLPSLHMLSSFEKGSDKLRNILKTQSELGNLGDKGFAVAYCRSLILIARAQDPELLKDPALRLRAYLLAINAEVKEIEQVALRTLAKDAEADTNLGKAIKITLSKKQPIEKIKELDELEGNDASFCIKYYLAQLTDEQKKSPGILTLQLKQSLFVEIGKKDKSIERALEIFALLPSKTRKLAKYQTFLGFAQHLDEKDDEAIKTLKKVSTRSSDKEMAKWGKTAHSYADGLQNSKGRQKLLLEALGKSIDRLSEENDAFFIEAQWTPENNAEKSKPYQIYLGLSKSKEAFEIQLLSDEKLTFAFRTDALKSSIIPPMTEQIISFKSPGALPVPRVDILRDIGDGSFNYNFNLSFAPTFAKLAAEGASILKNPYVGTNKGREVLVNYLLSSKPIWLGPARSIKGGTSYPVFSIDPDEPAPSLSELAFDVTGNLSSCRFGSLSIPTILHGDQEILDKMPEWPDFPKREEEKFDFALMMEIITQLSKLSTSSK
jgi:hypothetical protein